MQSVKKVLAVTWKEFVYGGHLVSVGLAAVVTLTALLLDITVTWDMVTVVYLLSLIPCLFGRYFDLKNDALTNPERSTYLNTRVHRMPFIIVALALALVCILAYFGKYSFLLFGVGLIALSFLYDVSVKKWTRKMPGFKNIFISILFSLLILTPIIYYSVNISAVFFYIASFIFLRILIGTSFSDLKDIKSDGEEGLKTLAVVLKPRELSSLLVFLNLLTVVPIVAGVWLGLLHKSSLFLLLSIPFSLFYIRKYKDESANNDFLFSVVVDSELFLWLLFLLIGKMILR